MNELLKFGAFELAQKIRDGEVTPSEVVRVHIERQKEVNPKINAIVEERYDAAMADAQEKTEALAKNPQMDTPALFGVPFTVKEMLSVQGMKSTAGSLHRRDRRSDFDATLVGRMKAAGAIPLATTNVPELGFWFETENPIYGRTNNPYDLTRTSGGSSGGEGAMIGAGGSPFGLGSDIGGSIRLPAALCGISGHKPTNRLLPLTGHYPYSLEDMGALAGKTYPYTSTGPLARKAKDLRPLTELMMGPDEFDRETLRATFKPSMQDPSRFRVFVCEAPVIHLTRPTDADVRMGVRNSARYFEQMGASVEDLDPKMFLRSVELWASAVKSTKERTFAENLSPQGPVNVGAELLRAFMGKSRYTVPSLLTVLVEQGSGTETRDFTQNLAELEELRVKFNALLGENGILICPVHSRTAPKHRAPWLSPFDFVYTGIFNVLGNPATAVPVGMSEAGLPLSAQIVAAPFHDHLTLSAAEILEDGFGGWTPPSL